jgi:hypothetical protein
MQKIVLEYSDAKARGLMWLLGGRYGKRKSLQTLIGDAITEIAKEEAEKMLGKSDSVEAVNERLQHQ